MCEPDRRWRLGGLRRKVLTGPFACAAATLVWLAAAPAQQIIQPAGPAWSVQPKFEKNADARKAISGAACAPTLPPVCLAANDEKKYAQFFSIKDTTLAPAEVIRLVPNQENGFEFDELDAEGVAYDDGFFYVVGSHGAPRKSGKPVDASRFFVFRFKVNEQSGKPEFRFSDEHVDTKAIAKSSKLRDVIRKAPPLASFAEKPLNDENGANIEGIAVKGPAIFLGFRGPVVGANAFILAVDANGVFGPGDLDFAIHPIPLGEQTGIRDLAALKTGMLVLSGPAPDVAGAYGISHWNEQSRAWKPLATLGGIPSGGKPESLIVLDENDPQHYRVLVLIEGIENAHPLEYRVPR
jgi:Protein of unknown function (DUF3616)